MLIDSVNHGGQGDKKMKKFTRKEISLRKRLGLATTARELENLRKEAVSGPEDLIIGKVVKGWDRKTWTVDTTGRVVVKK